MSPRILAIKEQPLPPLFHNGVFKKPHSTLSWHLENSSVRLDFQFAPTICNCVVAWDIKFHFGVEWKQSILNQFTIMPLSLNFLECRFRVSVNFTFTCLICNICVHFVSLFEFENRNFCIILSIAYEPLWYCDTIKMTWTSDLHQFWLKVFGVKKKLG